jgi:hypothetical protein
MRPSPYARVRPAVDGAAFDGLVNQTGTRSTTAMIRACNVQLRAGP